MKCIMWRSTLLYLCACVSVLAQDIEQESKVVNTAQGAVRGYKDQDYGIYSFYSIPYATAPIGPHKFKAPLPPPLWSQTFDAVNQGIICPQSEFPGGSDSLNPQEDCLIANVYTPDTEQNNLPVVVYVHGGAFHMGWGDMLVPRKLVFEHNIIYVTFNYRLGVHGFLCLGTEDAPGNAGLKDQVELLRWVNKNIAYFGGNPDDVTIAGNSAGAASVDLLMLSKSAEGLFNKVIPESGASTASFSMEPEPLENAKWFAKANNFDNVNDVYALEQFYKTASFEILTGVDFLGNPNSSVLFAPCVERASTDAFLDESPVDILLKGTYVKVPILYGFANMEGLLRIGLFENWKDKMNERFSDFLPTDLEFENEAEKEEVAKMVKEFYFNDSPVSEDNILAYVDYFSDAMFTYSMLRSTRLLIENGHDQIYLYEYSFVDENTPVVPHTDVRGADHIAQSAAVAGYMLVSSSNVTEEFVQLSSTMRQLWANFIKTGKPVPEGSPLPAWPAVRAAWAPHMSLGSSLQLRGSLLEHRASFWDDIYAKHFRNPLPPPAPAVIPPNSGYNHYVNVFVQTLICIVIYVFR